MSFTERWPESPKGRAILSILAGILWAITSRILNFLTISTTYCDCTGPSSATSLDLTKFLIVKPLCHYCQHTGIYELATNYFRHLILPAALTFTALTLATKLKEKGLPRLNRG